MNALLICLLAAVFAATANFFFRKSSEAAGAKSNFHFYFLVFYFTSLVMSLALSRSGEPAPFDGVMFCVGCFVGVLNMAMMWLTSRALLAGPSGLTFAFQNASSIFPGLLLFGLFGPHFGFQVSFVQVIGMGLVILGLYVGAAKTATFTNSSQDLGERGKAGSKRSGLTEEGMAKAMSDEEDRSGEAAADQIPDEFVKGAATGEASSLRWLKYALGCFFFQICALTMTQWRCLLFTTEIPLHTLIPWSVPQCSDAWFLPGQFGTAFLLQLAIFLIFERPPRITLEGAYGALGGILNFFNSFLLLLATKAALPHEKGLIFPSFAVATLILCNAWAYKVYKERFNMASNFLCSMGIFLGSLI
jgi:hypothetical protein